jgi:hypothetical protein
MQVSQGIYEHYKSTVEDLKLYQVLFLSHFEDTLEVMVHYQPLYYSNEGGIYNDGITIWTRTFANFTETVEWDGKTVARFTRVTNDKVVVLRPAS